MHVMIFLEAPWYRVESFRIFEDVLFIDFLYRGILPEFAKFRSIVTPTDRPFRQW
jgi:hypothetical protein